jgi:hypothetical protein
LTRGDKPIRGRSAERRLALGAVVALCALLLAVGPRARIAAAQGPLYSSTPSPLPPNVPGQGFESLSLSEVGDQIGLAGSNLALGTVVVTLSSYGCQNGFWNNDTCTSTPGSRFAMPITFNIYNTGGGGSVGPLIATRTQTFSVPYRPSDDDVDCPPATDAGHGRWFDSKTATCNRGLATNVTFDFSQQGVVLPAHVIYGVAFNTTHSGYNPRGTGTACFSTSGGCGYDYLLVGLSSAAPSVGTNDDPATIYQNSSVGSTYCDLGIAGTGTFRLDSPSNGCWAGTTPAVQFNERLPQTLVVDNANACANANFTTIQDAVNAALPGDTISVCSGTYPEVVNVTTPNLTLQGAQSGVDARNGRPGPNETIIDGTGGGAGILINADNVTVDGFTIENNSSAFNNGAGIKTTTAHSGYTLINNVFLRNSIGVYANSNGTNANLIQFNLFRDNNNIAQPNAGNGIYTDQGSANITVDSNLFQQQSDGSIVFAATPSPGEHAVTVTDNFVDDAAASFASVTGLTITGNTFSATTTGGIILAGGDTFTTIDSNNVQSSSGSAVRICNCLGAGYTANGRGISITNNTLTGNANGIEMDAGGISLAVQSSFNRIAGSTGSGVLNNSTQTLTAVHNWWGCNGGPGTINCDAINGSGTTSFNPWLVLTVASSKAKASSAVQITVDMNHDSGGASTATLGNIADGTVVGLSSTVGTLSQPSVTLAGGAASASLIPMGSFGLATVTATLDGEGATCQVKFVRPSLSINNVTAPDGSSGTRPLTFTVTMSAATDTTVTVSYETADGTATSSPTGLANPDYDATTGTLTFLPGVTSQQFSVMIHGYTFNEPVEQFTASLFSASNNVIIWKGTGTGIITNDDPFPKITVTAPTQQIIPGKAASFSVKLATPSDQTVAVKFTTADGTAKASIDYKPVSGVLTFTPGITTLFVNVATVVESPTDPAEGFYLVISSPTNGSLGTPSKALATIK